MHLNVVTGARVTQLDGGTGLVSEGDRGPRLQQQTGRTPAGGECAPLQRRQACLAPSGSGTGRNAHLDGDVRLVSERCPLLQLVHAEAGDDG